MTIEVSTTRYEFSHGKRPRGVGHWAFFFPGDEQPWWVPDQTYGAAKKAAVAEAQRRKVDCVWVGP